MSSELDQKSITEKNRNNTALIGAAILLFAVICIGLAGFFYGKREGSKNLAVVPVINASPNSYQKVLGSQTMSWQGKIVSVKTSSIVFIVRDEHNVEKRLTANVNGDTQLLRFDSSGTSANNPAATYRKTAPLSDFKAGKMVYVQGPNISARQSSFDAIAITLLAN